jgi:phosphoribosyl 1,2-cyclic phosphodiesterase
MFHSLASSSAGNLGVCDDGTTKIMLDCGLIYARVQSLLGYKVSEYAGCFLSHEHMDHARAAKDLIRRGIPVYCSAGTADMLGIEGEAEIVEAGQLFKLGSYSVLPFRCIHDCSQPLGYYIASGPLNRLLYAVDTCYLPNRFEGMVEIACELNHSRELLLASAIADSEKSRIMATHMSLESFLGFLQANDLSKVTKIHLLHMSSARGDAEGFKRAIQEATGIVTEVC